jgi:hypothetical protein
MAGSFALSFAAIDVLLEQLGLGPPPFPFEIPYHGQTHGERAGIRAEVLADLKREALTEEARAAVRLFAKPQLVITAFGKLDDGPLLARICRRGQRAIKAVGTATTVHFGRIRSTAVVAEAVALLPDERAGAGQSITVSAGSTQLARAQAMVERDKLRFGQFQVGSAPTLFWFDSTAGRYLITSSTGPDGQQWTTISPADNARIAQLLASQFPV